MLAPGTRIDTGSTTALGALDELLAAAVVRAQAAYGEASTDPFRGLHVGPEEIRRLLGRAPGAPTLSVALDTLADALAGDPRWAWLVSRFELTRFQTASLLIAIAPEVDLRYERLYAYLQDDVTKRRPTIDLVLNLLCRTREGKAAHRAEFLPSGRLVGQRLIRVDGSPHGPLLGQPVRVDEQIAARLLGDDALDSRLRCFCRRSRPQTVAEAVPLAADTRRALAAAARDARDRGRPLRVYFHGPAGSGAREAAGYLAGYLHVPLLAADLNAAEVLGDVDDTFAALVREADLEDAVLYLAGLDTWLQGDHAGHRLAALSDAVATSTGITLLSGERPWIVGGALATGVITLSVMRPPHGVQVACWRRELSLAGLAVADADVEGLATRFRLTPTHVREAVARAVSEARWRGALDGDPGDVTPARADLFSAARAQCGHELAALARKVAPRATWSDIVLPPDTAAQLREICARVAHRHRVLEDWGFGARLSLGKGIHALFAGPSGTGKTMSAEIIAGELGLDLYKIDLAGVVSKYIGETEKNLDRIFTAAEDANAVLLFDEADALFGKRSEVRDSHDRYANLEISYLLQKMEEYEGLAILSTNLRHNLDDAFLRRLTFTVHFPFPDEADRGRIWRGIWPREVPRADDLDLAGVAREFRLTGGNIKNVALAAAFYAAADGGGVTVEHLHHAIAREYQKMGKVLTPDELQGSRARTGGGRP